jgi:hypothetical protein
VAYVFTLWECISRVAAREGAEVRAAVGDGKTDLQLLSYW